MDKFVFVGVEKRKSSKGNDYFMLHYGKEIESKNGVGIKPISSRINKEQFEEFSSNNTTTNGTDTNTSAGENTQTAGNAQDDGFFN